MHFQCWSLRHQSQSMGTYPAHAIIRCHADSCPPSPPESNNVSSDGIFSCPSVVRIMGIFYHIIPTWCNIVFNKKSVIISWWLASNNSTYIIVSFQQFLHLIANVSTVSFRSPFSFFIPPTFNLKNCKMFNNDGNIYFIIFYPVCSKLHGIKKR